MPGLMLFSHKETWTEIRTAIRRCKQLQQIVRTSSSRRTEKGAQNCYKSARSPPNTVFDPQDDDIVKLNLNPIFWAPKCNLCGFFF